MAHQIQRVARLPAIGIVPRFAGTSILADLTPAARVAA